MEMMKAFKTFCEAVIVIVLLFVPAMIGGTIETHYKQVGIVTAINEDRIVVMDNRGELWTFVTDKDFAICDKVQILMFNNYTDDTIYDDVVVKVKKL
jgi:hypothetical protein